MADFRKTFVKGKMNKDFDERILPDGEYRHAENIIVLDTESTDIASVQNSLSNKRLTNLDLGNNVITLGGYTDETNDKLYWFTTSAQGSYLLEYDNKNDVTAIVLADTRPIGSRVLELKENFLITSVSKILNDDYKEDLLLWTDNNIEPCCINIERAKTWGENNFEEEDIYLIKKYPKYAPEITFSYSDNDSNNIEEKFLRFAYRYQYLDNEWSAVSDFTNTAFIPKNYDLDYYSMDNIGMINSFNTINIKFNTGDKRVKTIQLIVKESGKNNYYIIETFDKKKYGYNDNVVKSFAFKNDKILTVLPPNEIFRTFDNVPLKSKAMTIVNNRICFGNYTEQFDIKDNNDNDILVNFNLSHASKDLNKIEWFNTNYSNITGNNNLVISNTNTNIDLKKGSKIIFKLNIEVIAFPPHITANINIYENTFEYILIDDYLDIESVFSSADFATFFVALNEHFEANFNVVTPSYLSLVVPPFLSLNNNNSIVVNQATYLNSNTSSNIVFSFKFNSNLSIISWSNISSSASCKSNRTYEAVIIYKDKFGRKTTGLGSVKNTTYISNGNSESLNYLNVEILSKPPKWADSYKFAIKTPKLEYHVITVNRFYNDDNFTWVLAESAEKDKINIGDYLILKRTPDRVVNDVIKVKVLDIKEKNQPFTSESGISQVAGVYFKIKPNNIILNENKLKIYSNKANGSTLEKDSVPFMYLSLFSNYNGTIWEHKEIKAGTKIHLYFDSSFNYKDGWSSHKFSKMWVAQRYYATVEEWYNENCLGRPFIDEDGHYYTVEFKKGTIDVLPFGGYMFNPDPNGGHYLKIYGLESGGSNGRAGYCDSSITLYETAGEYIFETAPKNNIDIPIYYETEETFDIINGEHQGNVQNQDILLNKKALINLSFFNCFSHGNGVESYKIKDSFLSNSMDIDTKATSTTQEPYKQITRLSDLTVSEVYNNGTGYNGLNAFILANANFKELEKKYSSIQYLHTRDNDIVVFQEEKTSQVLFNKSVIYGADGSGTISSIDNLLGQQIFFMGENGVGTSPESIAIEDNRVYFANPLRGIIQRLSTDGIEDITIGMESFFRNLFNKFKKSKKTAGFDPYFKHYIFNFSENEPINRNLYCGNTVIQYNLNTIYSYTLNLTEIVGDIHLNYNITNGSATVIAVYDGTTYQITNTNGIGTLTIPRLQNFPDTISVTIIPTTSIVSFEITNVCPLVGQYHYSRLHYSSLHYST